MLWSWRGGAYSIPKSNGKSKFSLIAALGYVYTKGRSEVYFCMIRRYNTNWIFLMIIYNLFLKTIKKTKNRKYFGKGKGECFARGRWWANRPQLIGAFMMTRFQIWGISNDKRYAAYWPKVFARLQGLPPTILVWLCSKHRHHSHSSALEYV